MSKSNKNAGGPSPTRRGFLQGSSAALAGAAFASTLSIAQSAHAAGDDMIKIGLVGCGGRGSGACAQALKTKGNVRLVAVGDAFKDKLDGCLNNLKKDGQIADKVDVPEDRRFVGFDAYKSVIAAGPDLVIFATPPGFRPLHFKAAIDAGKHVFIEKPVATDAPGVRSVLATVAEAKKKNLAVGVGLQRHHQAPYVETVKRLHDGAIGDITSMRVYWNGAGVWVNPRKAGQTDMEYQMRNWYYFNWLCGDHIVEQHIHNLDVGNWVKNALPVKAQGMGGRQVRTGAEFGEIYDHHAVEFEYADGTRMFSYCRHIPNCWNSVTEYAQGTKGTCDVSGAQIKATGSDPWRYRGGGGNPYQVEHDDLFASIRSGNPLNEGEYGATSTMTAIMGRMATYSGKEVSWQQALNSELTLMPAEYAFNAAPPTPSIAVPGVTQAF